MQWQSPGLGGLACFQKSSVYSPLIRTNPCTNSFVDDTLNYSAAGVGKNSGCLLPPFPLHRPDPIFTVYPLPFQETSNTLSTPLGLPLAISDDALPAKLSELGLRPRSMTERPSYSVRLITSDDKDKVLDFLKRFFFVDEPLNQAVNLLETPDSRCLELEEYATSTLDQNVSVAAVDDDDQFVGIIINGLVRREDAMEDSPKVEECPNPKFRKILRVLAYLDKEARIWEKLPKECKRVLEIRIASTHSDWRGRGLMKVLCEETE
ncbi:Dopamine N-acetyltransferase [Eumeta japonica]|uniref:Dopamine N-acetyltransferase n=1 Tax=Eumeta variegata TaxID=151549 RepID=A0A4C1V695_EUMVA|nr:Dopamine N-acetyltransferase [Eumeta japonica]